MFDPLFELFARVLAFFYSLPVIGGSYGFAIILLTLAVMTVLLPLTLKATRSTIRMQHLQPELKALQKKYKDDRQTLNQETMAMYQKHGINPVGGCLPMIAQMPVFLLLYRIVIGLTTRNSESAFFGIAESARTARGAAALPGDAFNPQYLQPDTKMFTDLTNTTSMPFGPFDLSAKAIDIFQSNIFESIPYLLLLVFVVAASYYQQKQISSRRGESAAAMNPIQQQMMRIMPLMSGVWGFVFPAALVLYWATSNVFRIAQQGFITYSFYRGEDSIGKQAANAQTIEVDAVETKKSKNNGSKKSGSKNTGSSNKKKKTSTVAESKKSSRSTTKNNGKGDTATPADRSQAWADRRAKKAKVKDRARTESSASSRITPKGTKPSGPKNKRKR